MKTTARGSLQSSRQVQVTVPCHTAACSARVQLEPLDIQTARPRPRCCSERQSRATQSPAGCGNMWERMGYWLAVRRVVTVVLLLLAGTEIFACDAIAS